MHLLAHNQKVFVKKGDKVKQYKTKIATVGKSGTKYAHLHHSVSEGLTPVQLKKYIKGWTKAQITKFYSKPEVNYYMMFDQVMDVGNLGYGWLQRLTTKDGWHPALDINNPKGGNSDLGMEYTSPCDGEVVAVEDWGTGWGKVVLIEEDMGHVEGDEDFSGLEEYYKGVDISHHQGKVDFEKLKDNVDFVIMKATQGDSYVDPEFKRNQAECRRLGIPCAFYHFADGGDLDGESNHFLKTVGDLRDGEIMFLDWEIEHDDPRLWVYNFLFNINNVEKKKCGLYTNDARQQKYKFKADILWIARYKDYTGDLDWDYSPRSDWDIFQYSSRGKIEGIKGNVDMNIAKPHVFKELEEPTEEECENCEQLKRDCDLKLQMMKAEWEDAYFKLEDKLLSTKTKNMLNNKRVKGAVWVAFGGFISTLATLTLNKMGDFDLGPNAKLAITLGLTAVVTQITKWLNTKK